MVGKVFRKVWAGPFDAGPLTHPVTVGDALLKLLQTIWRGLVLLVLAGLSLAAAIWYDNVTRPAPLSDQIIATVLMGAKDCTEDQPLLVSFTNGSKITVQQISFSFVARAQGRSSNLVAGSSYRDADVIIPPGRTASLCWTAPELEETAPGAPIAYSVDVSYASDDPAS